MRVLAVLAPRRPSSAVEPVAASASRERRREPVVVHVPVPLRASGAVSAVEEAYGLAGERRVVDLYL